LQENAIDPACKETIPSAATVIARRMTTPLYGAGLIEAIPDQAILHNARLQKADNVSGRASIVEDVVSGEYRVGRFGWKAQQATLLAFAGDAYVNEMGITNRFFPHENAPNGNEALLAQCDKVDDIEDEMDKVTGKSDIDHLADYMRLLSAPPQLPLTEDGRAGRVLFAKAGCAVCHVPAMITGRNDIEALDRKTVDLYSDLLLHDMGSLGDGIGQGMARQLEMKTAPLWGLSSRAQFLHDGRSTTVDDAIRQHDGEAAPARDRYLQLSPAEAAQIQEFLRTI